MPTEAYKIGVILNLKLSKINISANYYWYNSCLLAQIYIHFFNLFEAILTALKYILQRSSWKS
jgi:hypothetical protein